MILQFDQSPILYWVIGYLVAFSLILGWWKLRGRSKLVFLTLGVLVFVVWMRLPVLVFNQEIDPDESQMLGHAITLKSNPVYWKYVDAHTIGPLTSYVLILPSLVGFTLDYTAARVMGLFFMVGSLFFFFLSLRRVVQGDWVWIIFFPLLFFLAFTQEGDFVHYSSEQLSLFFLNIALWLYLRQSSEPILGYWFLLGFMLGLLPFCKLQVVPIGLVIGLFSMARAYLSGARWRSVLCVMAGALAFPIAALIWVVYHGLLEEFWTFYIQGNLIYADGQGLRQSLANSVLFLKASPNFTLYLISLIPFFVVGVKQVKIQSELLLAVLMVVAAYYSIVKTGNIFPHYLNLLLYPLTFLVAILPRKPSTRAAVLCGVWICLLWVGRLISQKYSDQPLNRYVSTQLGVPVSPVSKLILQHATSQDRLTIWGWMGKYHVETQMPQGAAEAHTERCIFDHPLRQEYYRRYLQNLQENQPKVFVDAVGPRSFWVQDRATQGHEAFPELRNLIATQYDFVGEVDFTRVYVRK